MDRPRRFWQRRRLRVAVALAAVIAGVVAVPFVFTTSLVRYYLAHSDFANFNVTIDSASLSPAGNLVLHNLAMRDIREHAGKPLLAAKSVRVEFAWSQLRSNRVRLIDVEDLHLHVRAAEDLPISLLRLANPASPTTRPAAAAPTASSSPPVWFDQLIVTGSVHIEGFEPWILLLPEAQRTALPISIHALCKGDLFLPTREFVFVGGGTDSSDYTPALAAKITATPDVLGNTNIAITNLSLRHASATLTPELLRQLVPGFDSLPTDLRRQYELIIDTVQVNGHIVLNAEPRFTGDISLRDVDLVARSDGPPFSLDSFSLSGHVEAPLSSAAPKNLTVTVGEVGVDAIQYGPWRLSRASANFEIVDGTLSVPQSQALFGDGTLVCTVDWPLTNATPARGSINLRDADITQILQRMPDEVRKKIPVAVYGLASAKITFATENLPGFTGRIEFSTGEDFRVEHPAIPNPHSLRLNNASVAGQFIWSGNPRKLPEISRGKLRADTMTFASVDIADLSGSVQFLDGILIIDTFRASVGEQGTLDATLRIDTAAATIDSASLSLTAFPAANFKPWLPSALRLEADATLTATLQHSDKAPSIYALTASITLPEASVMHYHDGAARTTAPLTLAVTTQIDRDFRAPHPVEITLAAPRPFQLDSALISQFIPPSQMKFKNALAASLEQLTIKGNISPNFSRFTGTIALTNLASSGTLDDDALLKLDNLALASPLDLPLKFTTFSELLSDIELSPANLTFDHLTYGKNNIDSFTASIALSKGGLSVQSGSQFAFAKGIVAATADFDLLTPALVSANITVTKLEQSVFTRSLFPESFTAEGFVSGDLAFVRNTRNQVIGSLNLASDSPGHLYINRETTQTYFAPPIKAAAVGSAIVIPPNIDQIIIGQLANYAYTTGKITARDNGSDVEVRLDFVHAPLTPADPGYGVKLQVPGQNVIASYNYPVHIPGLTVGSSRMTVAQLTAKGMGFLEVFVKPQPASRPATAPAARPTTTPAPTPTTAPSTSPATTPTTAPATAPATAPPATQPRTK